VPPSIAAALLNAAGRYLSLAQSAERRFKAAKHHGLGVWRWLVLAAVVVGTLFGVSCQRLQRPAFKTPYQAVLLVSGQLFFGKLQDLGASYATLIEVFYLQSQVNPQTKEVSNILIKRGREWHKPDIMYINTQHIVAIENVAPDSQVAELISKAQAVK
jgi:hypothetical protein